MMGIYIPGMEMPTARMSIEIAENVDGKVCARLGYGLDDWHEVISVPEHGRLVDADKLRAKFPEPNENNGGWRNPDEALVHKTGIWAKIDAAPTVIPKEET